MARVEKGGQGGCVCQSPQSGLSLTDPPGRDCGPWKAASPPAKRELWYSLELRCSFQTHPRGRVSTMGGAASMLKKKKEGEDIAALLEADSADAEHAEQENEDANKKRPSAFAKGFASLKSKATSAAKAALAKVGLAEEEEEGPGDDDEEDTPQKKAPLAGTESGLDRSGSQVRGL